MSKILIPELEASEVKPHPNAFPYRAWAIMVTGDPKIFRDVLERALEEAPKYLINRIEFHDFVYPSPSPEGFVENVVRYEHFERMRGLTSLRFDSFSVWLQENKPPVDLAILEQNAEHFRAAARLVKAAGLKLNVWFHSFREIPMELMEAYPELLDPDSDFLFQASEWILDEFLRKVPEVDAITLTSLAETRSLAELNGSSSAAERIERFYRIAHKVCQRHGRELILRDFGGGDEFWAVAARLPEDIRFMTKWMPTDWERVHHPISGGLHLAKGKRFVVEWDLRGEYLGQGFVPYVNPKHFWIALQNVKHFEPEGCVGRIHWTDWKGKQHEWSHLFDSANGLNAHIYNLGMALADRTPAREIPPCLHADLLPYSWIRDWMLREYGEMAWPALYEVFKQTPRLVEQIYVCADRYQSDHSFPFFFRSSLNLENMRLILHEAGREYIGYSAAQAAASAGELKKMVQQIEIQSPEKKTQLLRSFDIMETLARLQQTWLSAYADLVLWSDGGRKPASLGFEIRDAAVASTSQTADALGGGFALMIKERLEEAIPKLDEWLSAEN